MRAAGRKERVRANGLEDGIGNTRMTARATEPDLTIWIRSQRTPYGPAANEGCIKRPDIRQYLTTLPPTRS